MLHHPEVLKAWTNESSVPAWERAQILRDSDSGEAEAGGAGASAASAPATVPAAPTRTRLTGAAKATAMAAANRFPCTHPGCNSWVKDVVRHMEKCKKKPNEAGSSASSSAAES